MHLFGHTFDHDYYFELTRAGDRDTHSISRCFTSHHRDVRAFPRTNRTFSTARSPIPSASSSIDLIADRLPGLDGAFRNLQVACASRASQKAMSATRTMSSRVAPDCCSEAFASKDEEATKLRVRPKSVIKWWAACRMEMAMTNGSRAFFDRLTNKMGHKKRPRLVLTGPPKQLTNSS
jgi:hypothetical protein